MSFVFCSAPLNKISPICSVRTATAPTVQPNNIWSISSALFIFTSQHQFNRQKTPKLDQWFGESGEEELPFSRMRLPAEPGWGEQEDPCCCCRSFICSEYLPMKLFAADLLVQQRLNEHVQPKASAIQSKSVVSDIWTLFNPKSDINH